MSGNLLKTNPDVGDPEFRSTSLDPPLKICKLPICVSWWVSILYEGRSALNFHEIKPEIRSGNEESTIPLRKR